MRAVTLVAVALMVNVAAADYMRGLVIGSGQWSLGMNLSVSESVMKTAQSAGVGWIRLIPTAYVASTGSTRIYTKNSTEFRSDSPREVAQAIASAHSLGLKVLLSPMVDLDWSLNKRGTESRGDIGQSFSESQWQSWFSNYQSFLSLYLSGSGDSEADMFCVGDGLQQAARSRGSDWSALLAWARTQTSRPLTYASTPETLLGSLPAAPSPPSWLRQLDVVGVAASLPLDSSPAIPHGQQSYWPDNGTVPSAAQFAQAWAPHVEGLAAASSALGGKPLLFTAAGYQSRWGAWRRPQGVLTLDPTDGSCWERSVSLETQSNLYEGLLMALEPQASQWWVGVFWWMARVDPSGGGSCDDGFSPVGKPALSLLASRWGGSGGEELQPSVSSPLDAAALASLPVGGPLGSRRFPGANASKICGSVFGAGEWSSPQFRLDSQGAFASLAALRATGATWVRLITNWFGDDVRSVPIYRANGTSPMSSATDNEIRSFVKEARRLGMHVHLAPYIDPNWDLLQNCRGPSCLRIPGTSPKAGRGEFGASFSEQQWGEWFNGTGSYGAYIRHMAALANETGCEMFSVASETSYMFNRRGDDLARLITEVRQVFNGHVTAAVGSGDALKHNDSWWQGLDSIGVEGYFRLQIDTQPPAVPTVEELTQAWREQILPGLQTVHEVSGKPIQFTEVGYQSRAGSWNGPASTNATDPEDCSVTALCAAPRVQAALYDSLMTALFPQDWFLGVQWWLWRAAPDSGGATSYSFTPKGKPAEDVMRKWYKWYA